MLNWHFWNLKKLAFHQFIQTKTTLSEKTEIFWGVALKFSDKIAETSKRENIKGEILKPIVWLEQLRFWTNLKKVSFAEN